MTAGSAPAPDHPTVRVDERDTMFARMARESGTPAYDEYYGRRPELREVDDEIRALPRLCAPGGRFYDETISAEAVSWFEAIDDLTAEEEIVATWAGRVRSAPNPAPVIRRMALDLGAVACGFTRIGPASVYTHKGRFDEDYGRPVDLDHPHAVVFLVEMEHAAMMAAPRAPTIRESARQYFRAARIAMNIEAVLAACGHDARAHYDAHYDLILPPLAVSAGLGEMGRNNILVADRHGSRVRIGAVSTTLDLPPDSPVSLGVARFCESCGKCADNCPSRSLSTGDREVVRGVSMWPTDVESCHAYWRRAGTDCGICMAVCPFSHPDTWLHRVMRALLRRAPGLARPALLMDDLIYGRDWRRRRFTGI